MARRLLTKHVTSWDDGRVAISGASQQDTFTDRELVGFAVTTSDPACNSVINTQPTDFVINLSDAVDTGNCSSNRFHGERNSGELVYVPERQHADHVPLLQLASNSGGHRKRCISQPTHLIAFRTAWGTLNSIVRSVTR